MERDPSAIGQLQRVENASPIFEILILDFQLAFELDPLTLPNLRLSCSCGSFLTLRMSLPENGGAAEQHQNGQNECAAKRTAIDPGEDLFFHESTFRSMVSAWARCGEITEVQSANRKDNSEVHEPLCRSERREDSKYAQLQRLSWEALSGAWEGV
jgi:hypothetical protein